MARRKKPTPKAELPELTPLELELMKLIWEKGNATAAEVAEAIRPQRDLADTTIHTVLANLRKKGYIEPIPTVERALRFAPLVRQEQVASRSLRQLVGDFFGGSPKLLLAHLMQQEDVSEAELEELRRMIGEDKKDSRRPTKETKPATGRRGKKR